MNKVELKKIQVLVWLSALAIIAISFMKSAMELEDAEQAYYSQWWRLGYDDQPPLYTWLQNSINAIFGVTKFSFSLLRAIIFSAILVFLYQFSKGFLRNKEKALLTVFSLALIPTFIDFTFRRLSHTALLCLAVVATYWIIQRLLKNGSLKNYILFGSIVGVGMLSKYNYFMVLLAIGVVFFFDSEFKKVFWNKYILVSVCIALLIVAPHMYWLVTNYEYVQELKNSVSLKTGAELASGIVVITPLLSLIKSLSILVLPLFVLLAIGILVRKLKISFKYPKNWLLRMLCVQLIVLTSIFVILDVQIVTKRWLLPIFLPFVALIPRFVQFKNQTSWLKTGYGLFLAILFVQTVRTLVEIRFQIPSDVHYGYQPIVDKLEDYPSKHWVMPNVTAGGNIRLLSPDSEIHALDDFTLPEYKKEFKNSIIMTKEDSPPFVNDKLLVIDSIPEFGRRKEKLYFYVN